jgi:hypothetical protein
MVIKMPYMSPEIRTGRKYDYKADMLISIKYSLQVKKFFKKIESFKISFLEIS